MSPPPPPLTHEHEHGQYVDLTIADVMTRDPICFTSIVSVGHVYDTLKDWKHHSFPIIDVDAHDEPNYILLGTVPRKVRSLLSHRINSS
jgi:CBS domain-containing protein